MNGRPPLPALGSLSSPATVKLAALLTGACELLTALVPLRVEAQAVLAVLLILTFLGLRSLLRYLRPVPHDLLRIVLLGLGLFVSLRYLGWRAMYTISTEDFGSFAASLTLFAAELYAIGMYFLGIFVNIQPLERPDVEPQGEPDAWPTVDVLVPTYDEPVEIVETTLIAATQLDYPRDKVRVYLCDDGGTDARLGSSDLASAATAADRAARLREICLRTGATYVTRPDNRHAKAGNINAALPRTQGELLLMLDCDHVPTEDILKRTVGYFQRDPRLFLVQTPHFFVTPDPVERNLKVHGRMPGESEVFYDQIQLGLDFWESSFFCGSAALLRRSHLADAKGLATFTVTEDAETSLGLHGRGLRSVYVNRPMVAGLQPPSFDAFVRQRARWAQGMTQIFLLTNPLAQRGLKAPQRLSYLNSTMFWFFGFARLIFLLAPAAFLILGLKIFNASPFEILVYAIPHVVVSYMVDDLLFGDVRWLFFSQLYEVLLAPFNAPALLRVFRNPRAPTFRVTPKAGNWDHDFISQMVRPFYLLYAIAIASVAFGIWRWDAQPLERETTAITLAWITFSLFYLHAALGALLERRQRRKDPRVPAWRRARLTMSDGSLLPGRVTDLSLGGARFVADPGPWPTVADGEPSCMQVVRPEDGREDLFDMTVRRVDATAGGLAIGLAFAELSFEDQRRLVAQAYGSSQRWQQMRHHRTDPIGITRPLAILFWIGTRYLYAHFATLLAGAIRWRSSARDPGPDRAPSRETDPWLASGSSASRSSSWQPASMRPQAAKTAG